MELKNCNAKTSEEVAIEVKINKAGENMSNIDLEILYNSCIEWEPSFEVSHVDETA